MLPGTLIRLSAWYFSIRCSTIKNRFIDDKRYWTDDHIGEEAGDELTRDGFLPHSPTFKLGRALLNEVFYIQPHLALGQVTAPTLIVHGTRDTFVPVDSSRSGN